MEIIDLYRQQHVKTGITHERGDHMPDGMSGMVVFVCVFHPNGTMLIQQRAAQKSWGNYWDVSAGGVVRSGEDSCTAAARELEEEVGIKKTPDELTKVLSIYYQGFIHEIFTTESDAAVSELVLQEEEVQAVRWVRKEEIHQMINNGEFLSIYPEFIDLLFRMKTRQGIMEDL